MRVHLTYWRAAARSSTILVASPGVVARHEPDADLTELGNMLVRGLSIEEIAQLLDRDRGDIQDKVVEKGRACRGSAAANSER
jgi:hypothetical protein